METTAARGAAAPAPTGEASARGGVLASAAAVGSAVLASLCCIGPLLFVTLGVGAGLASTFEPLRPYFTGATALLLGIGFYVVYGKRPAAWERGGECAQGEACGAPRGRRRDKVVLWTATFVALVVWSFTYWSRFLI